MTIVPRGALFAAVLAALVVGGAPYRAVAASDPGAIALAESTLAVMGGADAWDKTRYLRWSFFGRRLHHWDKATGDVRIASGRRLILMNLNTKLGRVWENGNPIVDPVALATALDEGYGCWVNDSYWFLMPYKLLDPGVILRDSGDDALTGGRPARKIVMTFEDVGLTPGNKYDVWIAKDTGLVEEWAYYDSAADAQPKFRSPWGGWKTFGRIRLATEHGRDADWKIAVFESLPREVFEKP